MKALTAIERNGKAQARLISDLLDMSRLNVGKMRLTLASVDVVEVVRSASTALIVNFQENDNTLRIHTEPALPSIQADAERLQQVFWNLLSNAVKFSPKGAPIDVAFAEDDGGVRIRITDQGRGISPEFLPQIFDRFTQADRANQRNRSGLGLGLSIVQNLVQAHGGTVAATSEGLNKGATFDVWLPFAAASVAVDPASGEELPTHGATLAGVHLLIVDDDPEARSMLQTILANHGAIIEFAANYDEALQSLIVFKPDLILCDIGLPGKDGYQLIAEVRRSELAGERVPAIALTAFAQVKDSAQALAAGFDVHVAKPVRPFNLLQTIVELLHK
jgi:CheY-like chemotaxis protein/two-component sensor histidine kinase